MNRGWAFVRWLLLVLLTFTLVVAKVPPAPAQLSLPDLTPQTAPTLPNGVTRVGSTEIKTIYFDGQALFEIASPTVLDRNNPGNVLPVEVRARRIEENLALIVAPVPVRLLREGRTYNTLYDPKTVLVSVAKLEGQTVLTATDRYRTQPQTLMTVTARDAELNGVPQTELAEQWRDILQTRIVQALEDRQPAALVKQVQFLTGLGLAIAAMSLLLWLPRRLLKRWRQKISESQPPDPDPINTTGEGAKVEPDDEWQNEFVTALQKRFSLAQRLSVIDFLRWLLLWAQVLLWLGAIGGVLYIIPQTRTWARLLLALPVTLLLAWFTLGLLNRLGSLLLDRFAKVWKTDNFITFQDVQRRSLRITTIISAAKGLKTFIIYTLGIIWILRTLGIDTSSVLALGAVIAFAVSLAFQNLIKDLVNGFLILLEDQYAIGDIVTIGSASGMVENMNLRMTQLRNVEGRLITIPNSLISQVENMTRTWARVDFIVEVAYETDAEAAIALIRQVGQEMYQDPTWHSMIVEPPEVLGVENLSHMGIQLRTWVKTIPLQQWVVGREFRLRVKKALDQHHVHIGTPKQVLYQEEPPNGADKAANRPA